MLDQARQDLGDAGGVFQILRKLIKTRWQNSARTSKRQWAAMRFVNLRPVFIALSPPVQKALTFGLGVPTGPIVLVLASAMLAALARAERVTRVGSTMPAWNMST